MVPESEGDATPSAEPKGPAPELTPVVPSGPSLPEVSVRTIGLHVGGGPNDPAGRAPFIEALEGRFPELLRCYREIGADASSGGTFGADIHIDPKGAPVRVDRVRTAIGGDELKACVVAVLETAAFQAVKRPTVVSYSIRFDVSD